MAQIGHGYGSEWQLLRMLGHHRKYFFNELRTQLDLSPDAEIHWLDYEFDAKNVSGDKEDKQREFFDKIPHIFTPEVKKEFDDDNFGKKLNQNWDGIFWVDDTVYLVEAKAHTEEIKSDCQAIDKNSISVITKELEETKEWFHIISENDWKKTYYQMANRIAFLKLLISHDIEAKLVNIYFVNGYEKKVKDPDSERYYTIQNKNTSIRQWEEAIREEEGYLGISDLRDKYIFPVYVNCKEEK